LTAPAGLAVELVDGLPQRLGLQNSTTVKAAVELGLSIARGNIDSTADITISEDSNQGELG
jgi:hypothetical protein